MYVHILLGVGSNNISKNISSKSIFESLFSNECEQTRRRGRSVRGELQRLQPPKSNMRSAGKLIGLLLRKPLQRKLALRRGGQMLPS